MADNTQVNNGTGDVIRDIDRTGVKTQVMQLDAGGTAAESLVSNTNPLPVKTVNGVISGTITTSDILCPAPTGNGTLVNVVPTAGSYVVLAVPDGSSGSIIEITGTLSGYFFFEKSIDSTNGSDGTWVDTLYRTTSSSNVVSPLNFYTTSTGIFRGNSAGFKYVRVRNVGGGTVSATVIIRESAGVGPVFLNSALPAGNNQIGQVTVNNPLTNPVPTNDVNLAGTESSDAPIFVTLAGDPAGDFAGVNILEKLVDDSGELKMAVRVMNPPAQDPNGVQRVSDSVGPFVLSFSSAVPITIDCAGYQSISIQKNALTTYSVSSSNDGLNFVNISGINQSTISAGTGSSGTVSIDSFLCIARYIRLTSSNIAGFNAQVVCYLKSSSQQVASNLMQNGTAITSSGGISQSILVGGRDQPGASIGILASTTAPFQIASADSGTPGINPSATTNSLWQPTVRRFLLDNQGRLRLAAETITTAPGNIPVINTQDASNFEGQTVVELLAQMIVEMRVMNRQLYDINVNTGRDSADEPDNIRNDINLGVFNQ